MKHLARKLEQSGDKSSGKTVGIQNLRLQIACKKFPLEAAAKELWKAAMCLNKILVASCSIRTCSPLHSLLQLPAHYIQLLCVSGVFGNEQEESSMWTWRWAERTEITVAEGKKEKWDTTLFPKNQPKTGNL